jgi:hypothetical protein
MHSVGAILFTKLQLRFVPAPNSSLFSASDRQGLSRR